MKKVVPVASYVDMHMPIISVYDCKNTPTYTQPQYYFGAHDTLQWFGKFGSYTLFMGQCMSGHPYIESVTTIPNIRT